MKSLALLCMVFASILGTNMSVNATDEPIVIAHRGASGYAPEHTISSYKLAIEQGADFIEPDLVLTKDGHFIARHDAYLSGSTNIADLPEFADRKRTFHGKNDWFVFDFTLEEIKKLKARQPRPSRGTQYDDKETIPTLDEIISLVKTYKAQGKPVGLYVEMKRPDAFKRIIPDLDKTLSEKFNGILSADIPLYFQCFDGKFLLDIADYSEVPLVLLVGGRLNPKTEWYENDVPLQAYAGKVAGFGFNKALLVTKDGNPTGIVEEVHNMNAVVHIWTIRNDQVPAHFQTVEQELKTVYALGVDGVFTDFPDTALKVRNTYSLIKQVPTND